METAPETSTQALLHSLAVILVSEIGDKTFLLAAILAMRHARATVFAGAFASLALMSLLSAALGHVLPALLPRRWTQLGAAALFVVFGAKMVKEGREMEGGNAKVQEEMAEAEEEIEGDSAAAGAHEMDELEEGRSPVAVNGHHHHHEKAKGAGGFVDGARNLFSLCLGPVFVQAFVLTFLAEWGDRSQIATIALGAAHNVALVTLGTVAGHACCTAAAVAGGRWLSTKISPKHVTLAGGALFLLFGLIYAHAALAAPALEGAGPGGLPLRPDDPDALLVGR